MATAFLRVKARTFCAFAAAALRGKLILARRGDEFFELQFQLLDQPRRALGALPVQFAFELLDPQLEMREQRHVGTREVRRKSARLRCHEAIESDQAADSIVKGYPARVGRHVSWGLRQSIPDKR